MAFGLSQAAQRGVDDVIALQEAIYARLSGGYEERETNACRLAAAVYLRVSEHALVRADDDDPASGMTVG